MKENEPPLTGSAVVENVNITTTFWFNRFDNESPFGNNGAERVADNIKKHVEDLVNAYRRQYGFSITSISISEEFESIYAKLYMKR
jgi:hypothetical protein